MIREYKAARAIGRICHLHTHPLNSIRHVFGVVDKKPPHGPPSGGDISSLGDLMRNFFRMSMPQLQDHQIIQAVLDPRGIWYHRHMKVRERDTILKNDPHFSEIAAERAIKSFVRDSASDSFSFSARYPELQKAYAVFWRKVRFVSYDDQEPTCTGPDYGPEKK